MSADLAARTRTVLADATYLSLATVCPDGTPWSAVVQYAWLDGPLRLVFGSAVDALHSRNVARDPRVSGSLFRAGAGLTDVDGAQFTGRCAEITEPAHYHGAFYRSLFPDPADREQWALPPAKLRAPAPHRLYLVTVERWWLIDTTTWAEDRIDRRVPVPLEDR